LSSYRSAVAVTLGKSVYEHYSPAGKEAGVLPLVSGCRTLEVGFGSGALLRALAARGNDVYGVDAGRDIVENAKAQGFTNVFHVDVSEEDLPFDDDSFDAVYCYEVFEHLTNPHRLFFEIRRVLKSGHRLFFSVPAQEVDMGYGLQRHTFVYPGLLEKPNLERFLMQMYFRIEWVIEPGPTDWLLGHNYVLVNAKKPDKPDVVEVITKDVSVIDLYGDVLSPDMLRREVARELRGYARLLEDCVKKGNGDAFLGLLAFVARSYPREYSFYLDFAQRLHALGYLLPAKELLAALVDQGEVPAPVMEEIKRLLRRFIDESQQTSSA